MIGPLPPSFTPGVTSSMFVLLPAASASRCGEPGNGRQACVGRGTFTLVDHMEDFVHEPVETDKGGEPGGGAAACSRRSAVWMRG